MDALRQLFKQASKEYALGIPHYQTCLGLALYCQHKLSSQATFGFYGEFNGSPRVPYNVFSLRDDCLSRPIRPDLYVQEARAFMEENDHLVRILKTGNHAWEADDYLRANRVVYTAVMSLASCYDLWQRGSRKTPGTFFEFFIAGLLQSVFPEAIFSKHIPLLAIVDDPDVKADVTSDDLAPSSDDDNDDLGDAQTGTASVSTDLVIERKNYKGGVVVPLKITTRERIVQPFAHQRILDSAFGQGHYQSMIACISETQLDQKTKSVKQVCVPGTIELFQKYLAPVAGIYYCDLPQRYGASSMEKIVKVRSMGHFFEDITTFLAQITMRDKVG